MYLILISILCSVAVSVLLKLAPRWQLDMRQAIAGNYALAALLCIWWLDAQPLQLVQSADAAGWRVLIVLGVLLPSIFLVMAKSVNVVGVVRTDAAQRLSLVLPLLAAFTLFGETLTWLKGVGAVLGLIAMACIVARKETAHALSKQAAVWMWPLGVFVGLGVIDIFFKRMAQLSGVPFADVLFATFALACLLSGSYVGWRFVTGKATWQYRQLVAALVLGLLNFGNIYCYVMAHKRLAADPALVFSSMNIGVIVLATLVGVVAFREKLGTLNILGIGMAIGAILLLQAA